MMHDEVDRSEGVPWKKKLPVGTSPLFFFHSVFFRAAVGKKLSVRISSFKIRV